MEEIALPPVLTWLVKSMCNPIKEVHVISDRRSGCVGALPINHSCISVRYRINFRKQTGIHRETRNIQQMTSNVEDVSDFLFYERHLCQ